MSVGEMLEEVPKGRCLQFRGSSFQIIAGNHFCQKCTANKTISFEFILLRVISLQPIDDKNMCIIFFLNIFLHADTNCTLLIRPLAGHY